jgi:pimeloyl-ACP methyl ester carboxylesterase
MTQELLERIDYEVCGSGPTVVLVPGSCSTGAAWRPLISAWDNRLRCVTTSLLGYGGTAERRTAHDTSISHQALVHLYGGGKSHLSPDSFQHLDDIGAAEGKSRLDCRREAVSTIVSTRSLAPVAS